MYYVHGNPTHVVALIAGIYYVVSITGGWAQRSLYTGSLQALQPMDRATAQSLATRLAIPLPPKLTRT